MSLDQNRPASKEPRPPQESRGRSFHIAHVDPETGFSGGEVQVFLLVDGLVARGHRCTLVTQPGSAVGVAARERGLPVVEVPMRGDWDLGAVRRLRKELESMQPNVVHLHTGRANWLGGWAAHRAGIRAVSTRRMDRRLKHNFKTRLIYNRLVCRTAAISPAVLQQLHRGGVDESKTELIWSSVDPGRLVPTRSRVEVRAELGVGKDEFLVLGAGALVKRKGFDTLVEALARISSNVKLVIAGEGPERGRLEEQIGNGPLATRVQLVGHQSNMPNLLQAADGFAMPSRAEGLGVAALEAMALGLPILGAKVGGLAQIVLDGSTGYLLPPGDPGAWAKALATLAAEPTLARRMGEAGRERVHATFLAEQMVDAYSAFYSKACEINR